jgi:hypothetical protein
LTSIVCPKKSLNNLIQIQSKNSIGCHFSVSVGIEKRSQCQPNIIICFWQFWSLKMIYFRANVVSFLFDFLLVFKNVGVKKYLKLSFYDKTLSWALKMLQCRPNVVSFFSDLDKNVTISGRRCVIYILTFRQSSKHDMSELICVGRHT